MQVKVIVVGAVVHGSSCCFCLCFFAWHRHSLVISLCFSHSLILKHRRVLLLLLVGISLCAWFAWRFACMLHRIHSCKNKPVRTANPFRVYRRGPRPRVQMMPLTACTDEAVTLCGATKRWYSQTVKESFRLRIRFRKIGDAEFLPPLRNRLKSLATSICQVI